jgi:adenylate kinase family enzyme
MTSSSLPRIVVLGASGNGKSTVARRLAEIHSVPYVELDALHHGPNWTEASADELTERVVAAMDASDGWVLDGNYERKIGDVTLERADTAVWLDQPLRVILPRLWTRTAHRIRSDLELWNGNKEDWRTALWGRDALFAWTLRSHRRLRRTQPARLARHRHLRTVRLRSPGEVERFLADEHTRVSLDSGILRHPS